MRLAVETLEELDWCLDQLESLQVNLTVIMISIRYGSLWGWKRTIVSYVCARVIVLCESRFFQNIVNIFRCLWFTCVFNDSCNMQQAQCPMCFLCQPFLLLS